MLSNPSGYCGPTLGHDSSGKSYEIELQGLRSYEIMDEFGVSGQRAANIHYM